MLLPQTEQYALRAMVHMASLPSKEPIRAKDLSPRINVPIHYLSKVLKELVSAQIIHSHKGRGGGFVLARPAEEISFKDILTAVGHLIEKKCVFGWEECNDGLPCPLHFSWKEVRSEFENWATSTTLANIKQPPCN